jgi:hypothetical protein
MPMARSLAWSIARKLEDVVATLTDLQQRPATPQQQQLADRLRQELRGLTGDAEAQLPFWRATCEALRDAAETGDPRFFMRWPAIAGAMVTRTSPFTVAAYRRLRRSPQWRDVWAGALHHSLHGNGPPFLLDLRTSPITVGHAGVLLHFQAATGRSLLAADCIVEFGGGYGSMCRLVNRLGFTGRYVIFDLPPILALQRYFLAMHGIELSAPEPRIWFTSSLAEVAAAMRPKTALVSTWALSEMPLTLRAEITALLDDERSTAALFAYQAEFQGIDNVAYFRALRARTDDRWMWEHAQIDDISAYLVGTRRNPG